MTKCKGCGIALQSDTKDLAGYVIGDNDYCERCFKITHYGEYKNVFKTNDDYLPLLNQINKESLVILVIDVLNIPNNLDLIKKMDFNNVLLVLTKRDLLPNDINETKVLEYMDRFNLHFINKIIVSSANNYHMDELKNMIYKYSNQEVYFIGYTNSGKSTLLNKLIKNYTDSDDVLTTSISPSTTLDFVKIKFNNIIFYDTPGLIMEGSIQNQIEPTELKKILPAKRINPIMYQIKGISYFNINNLFDIKVEDSNIVMYLSNNLVINRYYNKKDGIVFNYEFNLSKNEDIVILGIGFIKVIKSGKIAIATNQEINIFKRKSLL